MEDELPWSLTDPTGKIALMPKYHSELSRIFGITWQCIATYMFSSWLLPIAIAFIWKVGCLLLFCITVPTVNPCWSNSIQNLNPFHLKFPWTNIWGWNNNSTRLPPKANVFYRILPMTQQSQDWYWFSLLFQLFANAIGWWR